MAMDGRRVFPTNVFYYLHAAFENSLQDIDARKHLAIKQFSSFLMVTGKFSVMVGTLLYVLGLCEIHSEPKKKIFHPFEIDIELRHSLLPCVTSYEGWDLQPSGEQPLGSSFSRRLSSEGSGWGGGREGGGGRRLKVICRRATSQRCWYLGVWDGGVCVNWVTNRERQTKLLDAR